MERPGPDASGAPRPSDQLDLLREPGPFLTIWAAAPGAQVVDVRTAVSAAVRRADAAFPMPADVIEVLVRSIESALQTAPGAVAIADPSGVRLVEALPSAPHSTVARFGNLPSVAPLVEHRQGAVPFVLVLTDRQGAEVHWSASSGGHRRVDQQPDGSWEQTAAEVSALLSRVVREAHPRVITVVADEEAVQVLLDRLPDDIAALVRGVPADTADNGSTELRDGWIRRWVRTAVAEDTVAVLQLFEERRGQRERATDGPTDTLAALRESRVEVLLVHDDPDDARIAWFIRDEPSLVSEHAAVLQSLGYPEPVSARLADVAIRAALATGAEVRVVPHAGPVTDNLGAILRP